MRPIDFARMSPRNRMLNALAGGGMGRCGLVERNHLGAVTAEMYTSALSPLPMTQLAPAAPLTPVTEVSVVLAPTAPALAPQLLTSSPRLLPSTSVPAPDSTTAPTTYVNRNTAVAPAADPSQYAAGRETGYDPSWVEEDAPAQEPESSRVTPLTPEEIAVKTVKEQEKQRTVQLTRTATAAPKSLPWGKIAVGVGLLGLGWMLLKR